MYTCIQKPTVFQQRIRTVRNEYEMIPHAEIDGFHLFLVNMLYRTPHIHRDFEICLFLNGPISIISQNNTYHADTGDFILFNPFQPHELQAVQPVLILSVQISPAFFSRIFPRIDSLVFQTQVFSRGNSSAHQELHNSCIRLARLYLLQEPCYELRCASEICDIFYQYLSIAPHHFEDQTSQKSRRSRQEKIRCLSEYVEKNYEQKLFLTALADEMHVNVYYLSHFFSENFGMSFQKYLSKVRCEKARQMLLLTDYSLLDISMACGFSDPKYFNRSFRAQYGTTPKEYRKEFFHESMPQQQTSMLTTQEVLSREAGLVLLERGTANLSSF